MWGFLSIAGARGGAASKRSGEERRSRAQASLRLLRELLRHDYAIGYLMLGWLLRTTWAMAPAIALLLGLPQPDSRSKAQLPALLAWILHGSKSGAAAGADSAEEVAGQELLALLSAEELEQLQQQLVGPTAALSSFGTFWKAQQTLAGAPVTAQQVRARPQRT